MKNERKKVAPRSLTQEELALWRQVTQAIVPRPGVRTEEAPSSAPGPPALSTSGDLDASPQAPSKRTRLRATTSLDPRLRRRLVRGRALIDDVLDLHGMNQREAHEAVTSFLTRSQSSGAKLVLIVTGKGGASDSRGSSGEGVLRRSAPLWLGAPSLRPFVIGFEEAARKHGGSGALYVRIRKGGEGSP